MMRLARDQRGVAMLTVILVGAVLTVVASTAAFMSVQELRAGTDDRKGAEALAYAEAGIDRLILEIRRGSIDWGDIRRAGCNPDTSDSDLDFVELSGTVGAYGSYRVQLEVYNVNASNPADRLAPTSCSVAATSPRGRNFFAITSEGKRPAAKRVVRQIVRIGGTELPVGLFAGGVSGFGSGSTTNISLIVDGVVTGREKISFIGNDPYYLRRDFYGGDVQYATDPMPAAAHATGAIYFRKGGANQSAEHPPEPNCGANGNTGTTEQSLWDGSGSAKETTLPSGCSNWPGTGLPRNSMFTRDDFDRLVKQTQLEEQDYLTLRDAARTTGLYCKPVSATDLQCTKAGGGAFTVQAITDSEIAGLPNNFVAYMDFPSSGDPMAAQSTVKWKASVKYCSDDPKLNRSVVLVNRYSSVSMESGAVVTGAIFAPEGKLTHQGGFTLEGTVMAKEIELKGDANFKLTECWLRNMPGPFLKTTTVHWSEVDR